MIQYHPFILHPSLNDTPVEKDEWFVSKFGAEKYAEMVSVRLAKKRCHEDVVPDCRAGAGQMALDPEASHLVMGHGRIVVSVKWSYSGQYSRAGS